MDIAARLVRRQVQQVGSGAASFPLDDPAAIDALVGEDSRILSVAASISQPPGCVGATLSTDAFAITIEYARP